MPLVRKTRLDFTQYVSHTDNLADYLQRKAAKHSKKIVTKLSNKIRKTKDPEALRATIKATKAEYKGLFKGMQTQVRRNLATTLLSGAHQVSALGSIKRDKGRLSILDGLTKNVEFYTEAYYRRIVEPKLRAFIVANKKSATFERDFNQLVKRSLLETQRYWTSVADTVAGRAYTYGMLKGAKMRGHTRFELVAVIDERTTDFCRSIDGKTFKIDDGLESIEGLANLRGNNILHGPWSLVSEGKTSSKQMKATGFMTPPFHSHCRTRLHVS